MISKIILKSGSNPQGDLLEVEVPSITIFVGPNNAGKSLVLSEIESWAKKAHSPGYKIIDTVLPMYLTLEEVTHEAEIHKAADESGDRLEEYPKDLSALWKSALSKDDYEKYILEHPQPVPSPVITYSNGIKSSYQASNTFYEMLIARYTMRLAGENRLKLLEEQPAGSLLKPFATNYLSLLFRDNDLRARLRQIVFDAIGKYIVIDPVDVGILKVRLSSDAPRGNEEKSLDDDGVAFHKSATLIQEFSDGIRAFVGIIARLISSSSKIILVDEPEAYLHPALAMKLGKEIGQWSLTDRTMRLFASTHSAAFLMGCIQSGAHTSVIRLTYKDGVATSRVLTREKLLHLMRNPMLRSTGVLDGLFFEAVIITEADSDRAFYQEINERLLSLKDGRGIPNVLFINAQNKQTVWDIVKPLREMGIPAVGIVDLDMVKDGGTKTFAGAYIPGPQHQALNLLRQSIKRALDEVVKLNNIAPERVLNSADSSGLEKDPIAAAWKRGGGTSLLQGEARQTANNFFSQLEQFGVFVVQNGELESWLSYLEVPTNKRNWLTRIFERMGEEPLDNNYVKPIRGDVWDFIGRIQKWIDNPNRQGIPE